LGEGDEIVYGSYKATGSVSLILATYLPKMMSEEEHGMMNKTFQYNLDDDPAMLYRPTFCPNQGERACKQ
jgi:hypothetical protein